MTRPTVFVVDDDPAVRDSMHYLFDSVRLRCLAYPGAEPFLAAYRDEPGCLVLDLRMPGMSGIELIERLGGRGVALPVIVMTGYGDVPSAVRAMKRGAVDFLDKPVPPQRLIDAVHEALRRDRELRERASAGSEIARRLARLTRREREVATRAAAGMTSREIAAALGIGVRTAEAHRQHALRKTGCRNAAAFAQLLASTK